VSNFVFVYIQIVVFVDFVALLKLNDEKIGQREHNEQKKKEW
jgi:hypothetical protein